jgi:glycerol-3-phosphate acyltransferase PlsY
MTGAWDAWSALLALGLGFLAGSIPFGVIVLKLAGGPDPRTVGSGNIGATNVVRAGGKGLGALVLLLDASKGLAVVALFGATVAAAAAALGAVLGHCFTPWLRFRGGKGVATFLGVSIAGGPFALVAFVAGWLGAFAATRVSAIAGVTACCLSAAVAVAWAAMLKEPRAIAGAAALGVAAGVVVARHRSNFEKLAAERRMRAAGGSRP